MAKRTSNPSTRARAGWLTDGLLMLVGHGDAPTVSLGDAKGQQIIRTDSVITENDHFVSVARVPKPSQWPSGARLRVSDHEFSQREIDPAVSQALTLAQNVLASLDATAREQAMELLVRATAHAPSLRLARTLSRIRDAIRERQPVCIESSDHPMAIGINTIVHADDAGRAIYIRGWARDLDGEVRAIVAISPEGERIDLLPHMARFARKDVPIVDVHEQGFIACIEPKLASRLADGWVFELHGTSESAVELSGPGAIADPIRSRDAILEDLTESRFADDHAVLEPIASALRHWQAAYGSEAQIARIDAYGRAPDAAHLAASLATRVPLGLGNLASQATRLNSPEVSIVVPLFERIDLIEQQFAHFIHDDELQRRAELIYVLDSPELSDALRETSSMLYRLYGIPLHTITLRRGRSFAAAVNAGAAEARGRLLLTLHSDVSPDRAGWLGEMIRFHDAQPRDTVGAVGAKLLHEDDAIQHAGIEFTRAAGARFWQPIHRFKGFHRDAPHVAEIASVPALSGACMLMARDLFDQIGPYSHDYLGGAYADLDFCLRVAEAGRRNWYLPTAQLYHLEGQSWTSPSRAAITRFNRMRFTQRWDARLAETMASADRAAEVQRCR